MRICSSWRFVERPAHRKFRPRYVRLREETRAGTRISTAACLCLEIARRNGNPEIEGLMENLNNRLAALRIAELA